MPVFSSNRQRTVWAQIQPSARVILNSAGVWTSTGARKQRFDSFSPAANNPLNTPTFKTGNRSPSIGIRGRQAGSFTFSGPLIPSGAAGTVPDADPILQSIMGAAAVVVPSTSVTYSLGETLYPLFMPSYNKTVGATNPTNVYAVGAFPQSVKFVGGQNFLNYEVQASGIGVGDSQNFSAYASGFDSVLSGTLSTYPAEPGSATQNGSVISGFGSGAGVSFGGSALAEARNTIEIGISEGIEPVADGINDAYPIGFIAGLRQVTISKIQCIDSDGSVLNSLKLAARSKTPTVVTCVFGNVAGSIWTFTMNNVQPGSMTWSENGAGLDVSFDGNGAHATSPSVTDDFVISQT